MTPLPHQPILFTYDISVYGRKVDWYLTLRGFNHVQCIQPNRMPRPDLERLGIAYRRIPILAIGRDVYCDTRIIIDKLEKLFPKNSLGSIHAYEQGLERIMQTWINDGGPFWRSAGLIPPDVGVMLDQKWTADRSEMTGTTFNRDTMAAGRKDAYAHMKVNFEIVEHGILADGRKFIFATEEPTLADIHTIWPFDWVIGESMEMGEHLDPDVISDTHFPRVYAWVKRFREAIGKAQHESETPNIISSEDMIETILASDHWEKESTVDELDPLKLRKNQMVEVYPMDTGFNHHDRGRLVSLCQNEVVIESKVKDGNGHLRLHFPRHNFKIEPFDEGQDGNKV